MKTIISISLITIVFFTGCQKVYYSTMEKLGHPKRDLLVDRVEDARDSQEEAKEQFQSALEKFSEVVNFTGGQLEEKYKQLKAEFDKSQSKANDAGKHIDRVEDVAEALFDEWEMELEQYTSENLRRTSEQKLEQTRSRYTQLIEAMKRAESKVEPVLLAFRDQVLFLKHNLNAQAISSLQDELGSVETNIASLIKEMEASILEADSFIKAMASAEDE